MLVNNPILDVALAATARVVSESYEGQTIRSSVANVVKPRSLGAAGPLHHGGSRDPEGVGGPDANVHESLAAGACLRSDFSLGSPCWR